MEKKNTIYVISGAAGMTGSELTRQLLQAGAEVIGFDNFFASSVDTVQGLFECNRFSFFEYDLLNPVQMAEIRQMAQKKKGDCHQLVYINCAAVVHTQHFYHVEDTFSVNVLGMRSFLEQAIELHADVFINCSTSEVYSMQSHRDGGVREDDYLAFATAEHSQRTSYAAGKLMTEFFMKDAVDTGKIKGCSIRFANVYSRDERYAKHILPHIVYSLLTTKSVTLLENAKVTSRTFLHNFDSCAAVLALLDHEEALDGTVYNVATQQEVSILELVEMVAQQCKIENPLITFEGERSADPQRRVLSTKKLERLTGWKPQMMLEEGIRQLIQEARKRIGKE